MGTVAGQERDFVVADIDETRRAMLERLYERFNARDIEAVLTELLADTMVHHVYRLRDSRVVHMEIHRSAPR